MNSWLEFEGKKVSIRMFSQSITGIVEKILTNGDGNLSAIIMDSGMHVNGLTLETIELYSRPEPTPKPGS